MILLVAPLVFLFCSLIVWFSHVNFAKSCVTPGILKLSAANLISSVKETAYTDRLIAFV